MTISPESKVEDKITQEQNVARNPEIQTKEEAPKNSKEWENFRQARANERKQAEEIAKQAEKNAQEAAALRAALDSVLNKNQPQQQNNYDLQEETEEQRIEKKVQQALEKREVEYQRQRMERERQEYPEKLQSTFQDFSQVCNEENLDYLEYHYPEVASAFKHAPDGFDKWASIYKAVKRFVPNTDTKKDQAKAERNFNKPQSISSPAVSQSSVNAPSTRIDEQRKADNWARMQRALKGIA